MPLPTIPSGNVASAISGAYEVANSCRFDSGDSPYLHKTLGTATNEKKFTFSAWIKRGLFAGDQTIFNVGPDSSDEWQTGIRIRAPSDYDIHCTFDDRGTATQLITTPEYRDPTGWMHIVFAVDTTQSTEANRMKLYVNGVQQNDDNTYVNVYPSLNTDCDAMDSGNTIAVGRRTSSTNMYFDGYMAEVCFVDGTQYAASDFGEYDEDSPLTWKPKDVSGLTFGNNGFYLDFEDSSNLGNDANGGTDLTEVNLAATDQMTDSPTNNFCVINSLFYGTGTGGNDSVSITRGNLVAHDYSGIFVPCTFFVNKGKWYWENKIGSQTDAQYTCMGIVSESVVNSNDMEDSGTAGGHNLFGGGNLAYSYYGNNGYSLDDDSTQAYGDTYAANDIISVALDLDNNKLYFAKNGTWQNSGDPTSGATGTGAISITNTYYTPMTGGFSGDMDNSNYNFGGGTTWSVSSANSDANDGGTTFEYSPPSGYFGLCTKNLADYG